MKKIKYYNKKNIEKKHLKQYNKINDFIITNLNENWNELFKLGYQTFGILLVGFCEWIHENKTKNNIKNVIFLARDGYIIQKIYEILYPNEETKYMYISRRSLILPSIYLSKNTDEILNCMTLPPMFNISTFLDSLNININNVKKEIKEAGIKENESFKRSEYKSNDKIKNLVKLLEKEIKNKSEEQYLNFMKYLNQLKFEDDVAIIDIGWHNSIQKNLLKIIEKEKNITVNGYYLGVYDDAKKIELPHKSEGYLYSYGNNINRQYQTFAFVSLLESLFLSQEGTTTMYKSNKGIIEPIKLKYEYTNNEEMTNIIKTFQSGAVKFAEDYKKQKPQFGKITPDIASAGIIKFGCNPNKKHLEIFETINFENYKINNIVNFKHNTVHYLLHPKKILKDFYQSGWRIIFLKKLFKIPLPYYKIFKMICMIFNRR